jgi:pseudomonalisin/xanthomonalisin
MSFSKRLLPLMIGAAFAATASAQTVWVSTATHAPAVYAKSTGEPLAAAEALAPGQALHIVVSLQLRNRDQLDQRVAGLIAGTRTDFVGSLEAATQYLPTAAQAQAVANYLTQAGFRNVEIADNRLLVSADGSAAMAAAAFNTQLRNFGAGEDRVYANVSDAQVPQHLQGIVLAVHGLQTAAGFHTMLQQADLSPVSPEAGRASIVGHQPTDFPLIYNASGLPPATNATLGIISDGVLTQTLSDFAAFEAKAGFSPVPVTTTFVGSQGTDTSGTPEWDLDSQDSVSAAGGALKQLIFYVATSLADGPLTQAYNKAVSDKLATVINISLGECETTAQSSGIEASDDQIFALGVAQGQTFSVSSGDSGSTECGKRKGNVQSYPAVSPYVMALGGTTVSTTGTTTWAAETTWTSGGGGPSTTEAAKSWQINSGVLGTSTARGVPDIAFDSNPSSGAIIIVNGGSAQYGGTSLAAPLFAGFWARIQSTHGSALVSPASAFYQYGKAQPQVFHDITSGNNGGYTAKAGWDYTTGWGSLNVGKLASFINGSTGW